MPNVFLGQFVVGQVQRLKTMPGEVERHLGGLALALCSEAYKHMRLGRIADAVVELGHIARATGQIANQCTKAFEATTFLGDGDGKQRLAFFTHFCPLGHKAQTVKIHICTAQNRCVGLAFGFVQGNVLLDGSNRHRARRLNDAAGVNKYVLDGSAHRISVYHDEFIHQTGSDAVGFFTHQLHGGAICKQAHIF